MVSVVALVPESDSEARRRIRRVEGERVRLAFCEGARELVGAVLRHRAALVLVPLEDASGTCTRDVLRTLAQRSPGAALVFLDDGRPLDPHVALELGAIGITRALRLRAADFESHLRTEVQRAIRSAVEFAVVESVRDLFSPDLVPFLQKAMELSDRPVRVREVSRAVGVPGRTLRHRLAVAGLPGPQRLVGWCRTLRAIRRLEEVGGSVKGVLVDLRFATDAGFRNQVKRYTGEKVSTLLARGGFGLALGLFRRELEQGRAGRRAEGMRGGGRS